METNASAGTDSGNSLAMLESRPASTVMSAPSAIVRTDATAWEVVERFLTGPARHVVVVDDAGRYVGIIGTRHLAGLWPLDVKQLKTTQAESLGCAVWIALQPTDDLRTCAQTLTEYHLDAVPVVDEQASVVGVVTARDIARAVAEAPDHRQRIWQE